MRDVTIRLRLDISDLKAKSVAAAGNVKAFTKELERSADKRQALDEIGGTFGKVGLAATAAGALAVRAFANFDEAMSAVAATGEDAKNNLAGLRDVAIEAGQRTKYSATEAAAGIENLLKAGVSANDVMTGGLDAALDLAAAGSLEVGEAAEYAATAMNLFGINGAEVSSVADALAAGAGKAMGEVGDLGQALSQSGLVASQMGMSMTETVGSLSAFAQAGLLGSDAGTSLRTMLLRLANPSKESAGLMKRLGIEAYDAQGKFVGVAEVADDLQRAFEGKTQAERDAAMATIFGSDAIRAANVLYDQGEQGIRKWTKAVDDQGYAADVAATKMDNLKGDWEELTGALETALIGTGEGADGPLRRLVQGLSALVDVYNDLPQPARDAALASTGLIAAIGGGTWALSKVATSYANMMGNLDTLGLSFDRTGKKALLMRGAAVGAGAGLMALSGDIGRVDKTAGVLADSLGAAAIGFGVAGPWGAAVGGAVGLLKGLGDANKSAAAEVDALSAAFDRQSGKMNEAARAKAVDDLNQPLSEGGPFGIGKVDMTALQAAKALGIDLQVLTDAAMGSGSALAEVSARLDDFGRDSGNSAEWYREEAERLGITTTELADASGYLGEFIDKNADKWTKAGERARDAAAAASGQIETVNQFNQALGDIRPEVKTELKLLGYRASAVEIDNLQRKYNLTPEEVQTILAALDRATPLADRVENKLGSLADKTVTPRINVDAGDSAARIDYIGRAMAALRDRTLHIRVQGGSQVGLATGGAIFGPGSGTSDSIPAMLSNGEHVWTAREVQAAGGQGAVYGLRAAALAGALPKFAEGGAVEALSAREYASLRARINDLKRALKETEKGKGPGGGKNTRFVLRGWDRREAAAELAELQVELKEQNGIRRQIGKGKRYRSVAAYNRAQEAREEALSAADDRRSTAESFAGSVGADAFRSPASLERALSMMLRDSAEFTTLLADLRKKGASPFLLDQIMKAGPSRATNRTLRKLLADSARLNRLNLASSGIVSTANQYAALTSGSGFQVNYSGAAAFDYNALARAMAQVQITVPITRADTGWIAQTGQAEITRRA